MNHDQFKITALLFTVFCLFSFWISIENEKEIQRLTEQQQILTATVDSLRIEYYATNIEWGLYHVKFK